MKVKVKFDGKVIQQFFLDHVEKMVIGGVILFFLVSAYQSFSRKGYEQKPMRLGRGGVAGDQPHRQRARHARRIRVQGPGD